jgi:hypothetical protein
MKKNSLINLSQISGEQQTVDILNSESTPIVNGCQPLDFLTSQDFSLGIISAFPPSLHPLATIQNILGK